MTSGSSASAWTGSSASRSEGRTILFVSHSPDQVRAICDRAVVLSDGNMIGMGQPGEAVRLFRERLMEAGDELSLGSEPSPEGQLPRAPPSTLPGRGSRPRPQTTATCRGRSGSRGVEACYPDAEERRYLTIGETLIVRIALPGLGGRRQRGVRPRSAHGRRLHALPHRHRDHGSARDLPRWVRAPSTSTSNRCPCSTAPTTSTSASTVPAASSTTGWSRRASSR